MTEPFAVTQRGDRPSENLDGLLRLFFQAETPQPWPAFKPPAEPLVLVKRTPSRQPLGRSRMALAASLLVLLIGQLCLSGLYSDRVAVSPDSFPARFEATNRDGTTHLRRPKPQPKPEPAKKTGIPSGPRS